MNICKCPRCTDAPTEQTHRHSMIITVDHISTAGDRISVLSELQYYGTVDNKEHFDDNKKVAVYKYILTLKESKDRFIINRIAQNLKMIPVIKSVSVEW